MSFSIIPVAEASVLDLIKSIDRVIINPIIFFLFAVAIVYFLYGVAQYLLSPENEEVRKKSKSHMIWGIVGLFIMVGVFGIQKILLNTFGITNVQINNNGDFNVGGTSLGDRTIKDSAGTGQSFVSGAVDVSTDVNAQDLPPATYVTSPFPTYKQVSACWQRAMYKKANTEFEALSQVKTSARNQYLIDVGLNAKDVNKTDKLGNPVYTYPATVETKVMYNKTTKVYYAWLDVRAPTKIDGTLSDCSLEILKPAPTIASYNFSTQIVSTKGTTNVSSDTNIPELPLATFTTNPFPTYKQNGICWQKAITSNKQANEFDALSEVKSAARAKWLIDFGLNAFDVGKKDNLGNEVYTYPVSFETKVLYDKKNKSYYGWIDARSPLKATQTMSDCNLSVLTPAPVIPESVITSGEKNLSSSISNSGTTNYTTSPFTQNYNLNPAVCWRKEDYESDTTEYKALQKLKTKLRAEYLSSIGIASGYVPSVLPKPYATSTLFDKTTNTYYVWWDARGPVKVKSTDTEADYESACNLDEALEFVNESRKANPLQFRYTSDAKYYRAIGSGTDYTYVGARSAAIHNALVDIAVQKGVSRTSDLIYGVLPEEKYYAQDRTTGKYDYWLAVESLR